MVIIKFNIVGDNKMSFNTLVSTKILDENLENTNWVIFDCRSSLVDHNAGLKAYQAGHIPNAIFCNLETDLSSPVTADSGRHPLPNFDDLIKKLGEWGVNQDTQVVVYDDVGGAFAVRLWWQLRTFGHTNVAVLDGGIPHWINEERSLSTDIPAKTATTFTANIDENTWLSTKQIEQNLNSKEYLVLDARTPERYRGESEPIDTVAGRIPDSINRDFQLNLGENGLFLSPDVLSSQFDLILKQVPNQSAENLVHLCGSGVTSCHNMLAMEIAGLVGSKLYVGSWSEWIRDDNRAIATG